MLSKEDLRRREERVARRVMADHGTDDPAEVREEIIAALKDEVRRDPDLREAMLQQAADHRARMILATCPMPIDNADDPAKALVAQGIPLPYTGVCDEDHVKEVHHMTNSELLHAVRHCITLQEEFSGTFSENDDDVEALRAAAAALMAYRKAKFGGEAA